MNDTVILSREEFETMKRKAEMFDAMDDEELTPEELAHIEKAAKGPFITHEEMKKLHPEWFDI